jgi:hypothetical protein
MTENITNALTAIQNMVKDAKNRNCCYDINSFRPQIKGVYILTTLHDDLKLLTEDEILTLIDTLKTLYSEVYYSNIECHRECFEIQEYKPFGICPETERYLTIKF